MSPPIWIVKGPEGGLLDFMDVIDNEDAYINAWVTIINFWNFEPVRRLTAERKVTDRGIAILTLELAFFEPFGSILTGIDSDGQSQRIFSEGLRYFSNWMLENDLIGDEENKILSVIGTGAAPNVVYSYARCGLMHKMTMQGGHVFIDAYGVGRYAITDHAYEIASQSKRGTSEPDRNVFLIDPWRLLPIMERFLEDFKNNLLQSKQEGSDLYNNFKRTFERTIVAPGKTYFGI